MKVEEIYLRDLPLDSLFFGYQFVDIADVEEETFHG
jgi:hypothetical protein